MTQATKGAVPALKVTAEVSPGTWCNFRFDKPFKIGRLKDCDLFIDNSFVSRVHAAVAFEDGHWTVRDLGSANGLFFRGASVPFVSVDGLTIVRLGIEGPEVKLEVEKPLPEPPPQKTLRVKDPPSTAISITISPSLLPMNRLASTPCLSGRLTLRLKRSRKRSSS